MTTFALYFSTAIALILFFCLTRCFKNIEKKNKEISKLRFKIQSLERKNEGERVD